MSDSMKLPASKIMQSGLGLNPMATSFSGGTTNIPSDKKKLNNAEIAMKKLVDEAQKLIEINDKFGGSNIANS